MSALPPPGPTDDANLLTHTSRNDTAAQTILLIHGAGTNAADWARVAAHLPADQYHLLTPSLFTPHSLSLARHTRDEPDKTDEPDKPSSSNWQSAYAAQLATLLAARAHNGRAHIVGLSLGARLALALAHEAPTRVRTLFTSGLPTRIAPALPRALAVGALWAVTRASEALGLRVAEAALERRVRFAGGGWDGDGARASAETVGVLVDVNALPAGVERVALPPGDGAGALRVRIVAGTRRTRWAPVGDTVATAVAGARAVVGVDEDGVAEAGIDCRVYEAPGMLHPWNNQAPDIFAQCILATIDGTAFPASEMKEVWRN